MTFIEIEHKASISIQSEEDFFLSLWCYLVNNRKQCNKLAKELNIFPNPAIVYNEIYFLLLKHIL